MAIYEKQTKLKPGSRSNTKLRVSGGDSPAEAWIVDPSLPVLFSYEYGGPGQKDVVISKGMAVGLTPENVTDYETGKGKAAVTFAGKGGAGVIGLAPYNFSQHTPDFLDGNQPSIITREYVELPLFTNSADASQVSWGAVYAANLKNGDYVTYSREENNYGKLVKFDTSAGHNPQEIVGQVLARELDQEPWGWLKWAMWDETAKREDMGVSKTGYEAPGEEGFPFDPSYAEGVQDIDGYLSQYTTNPTGVPGILDGSAKAQTPHDRTYTITAGAAGRTFVYDLGLKNIVEGSFLNATLNGAAVKEGVDFIVDYKTGQVSIITPAETTSASTFSFTFRAHYFGTPAGWDYKGAIGAVRILLQR